MARNPGEPTRTELCERARDELFHVSSLLDGGVMWELGGPIQRIEIG